MSCFAMICFSKVIHHSLDGVRLTYSQVFRVLRKHSKTIYYSSITTELLFKMNKIIHCIYGILHFQISIPSQPHLPAHLMLREVNNWNRKQKIELSSWDYQQCLLIKELQLIVCLEYIHIPLFPIHFHHLQYGLQKKLKAKQSHRRSKTTA